MTLEPVDGVLRVRGELARQRVRERRVHSEHAHDGARELGIARVREHAVHVAERVGVGTPHAQQSAIVVERDVCGVEPSDGHGARIGQRVKVCSMARKPKKRRGAGGRRASDYTRTGLDVLGLAALDEPPEVDEHGNPLDVRATREWLVRQLEALHKRSTELREGVERDEPLAILEAQRFAALMKPHADELADIVAVAMAKRVQA